ncbi:MAG: hypothetical protein LAO24_15465 [Acidobacteriia bacterium]|nr:hypothetical protein [Terriglobia bacterium]
MEARQEELGRPLTDAEQYAVLMQHGDPMMVARRYWPSRRSLSLGWELIGPELFPAYLFVLGLNLAITLAVIPLSLVIYHVPITMQPFILPVVAQIVCVTAVFIILNFVRLKFPQQWIYPPAELASVIPQQRWYSISGLVACSLLTAWWMAIPYFQYLVLGRAAGELKLAPVWHRYYVPVLLLFLAGMGQRALSAVRPDWKWLLPTSRTVISGVGAVVMFFFRTHPLVVVDASAKDLAHAERLAVNTNNFLGWGLFGPWLWIYLGVGALFYAWYTRPHLRRFLQDRHDRIPSVHELNGVL